jgi:cytochrome c oxidase subunit 2
VPENTPVKLDMTSLDVIHSFYVAAYRIKMDTVPGMQTYVWFNSGEPAQYDIQCAEYCGVRHAYMLSKVVVLPEAEYEEWLNKPEETQEIPAGMAILEKHGCLDCHTTDGSELVGPSFKDIYGRETVIVTLEGEKTITVDEAYLKKAVYDPSSEIVKGFEDMMPPYKEEIPEEELDTLIGFFKGGMKAGEKTGAKGEKVAENEGCLGCHSTDGTELVGPSFKGLMDRPVKAVKDGKTVELTADTRYIIDSIKNPEDYVVEGYDPSMPSYDYLSDDDIKALLEYFSTLKE